MPIRGSVSTPFGQEPMKGFAERFARAIQARSDRSDRDLQGRRDGRVFGLLGDPHGEDDPVLGGDFGERRLDCVVKLLTVQPSGRIVVRSAFRPAQACSFLVLPPARLTARQVQAAMDHRAGQPGAGVRRQLVFPPEAEQRLLNGVPGQIVAPEDAARHVAQERATGSGFRGVTSSPCCFRSRRSSARTAPPLYTPTFGGISRLAAGLSITVDCHSASRCVRSRIASRLTSTIDWLGQTVSYLAYRMGERLHIAAGYWSRLAC